MIMWTGVLLGILFMIYGRVQQPAAAVSGSFHGTNEDISVGCDATRRLNRKDVIPWDASPSGLIVKHAHQSFHNWNATGRKEGRKELCIWSHIISSSIFPIKCMWCRGRWRPGFPRQTISLLDRYWTSRRRRRHFIRIKWIALEPVIGLTLK